MNYSQCMHREHVMSRFEGTLTDGDHCAVLAWNIFILIADFLSFRKALWDVQYSDYVYPRYVLILP